MKTTITRLYGFDAGHRVMGHEGHCQNPHGHRYQVEITAQADVLDDLGRVIDFSVLKQKVGGWLNEHWDHTFIVNSSDLILLDALMAVTDARKSPFVVSFNPTAENLAEFILKSVCPNVLRGTGVTVTKIKLWETPNCFAEVNL